MKETQEKVRYLKKANNEQIKDLLERGIPFNLHQKDGVIFFTGGKGGIISKLKGDNHYIMLDGKWQLMNY